MKKQDDDLENVVEEKPKKRKFLWIKKWPETSKEAIELNEILHKFGGFQVHMGDRFERDELLGYADYLLTCMGPLHEGHKACILRMREFLEEYDYFPQEEMQRKQEEEWQRQQMEFQQQRDGVGDIGKSDE